MSAFVEALRDEPLLVLDGGLSTGLELIGHQVGGELWTARLVLEAPAEIVRAHAAFVDAGAEVVISSSYQASEAGFARAGASPSGARAALALTTELARRSGARFVAASVGPFGAVLADGSEYHGHYDASWSEVRRFHRHRLDVLVDSGPDVFAVETIPTLAEAEIILELLDQLSAAPAWLSMSRLDDAAAVVGLAERAAAVVAVGVNCVPPADVEDSLAQLSALTSMPLVTYPNHGGVWDGDHDCWIGADETITVERVRQWLAQGARLIGGCCGNGPAVLATVIAALDP
jgi:S-methylmethionine-dependent homocysteine/selenocysteine methylase